MSLDDVRLTINMKKITWFLLCGQVTGATHRLTSPYPTPPSLILHWSDSSISNHLTPHTITTSRVSECLMAPSFTSANARVLCSGPCSAERHRASRSTEQQPQWWREDEGTSCLLFSSSNSNLSFLREPSNMASLFSFLSFFLFKQTEKHCNS